MGSAFWAVLFSSLCLLVTLAWMYWPSLANRFWRDLPDECEVEGCNRLGVRGNENIIRGIIMCDDCHAKVMDGHAIKLKRTGHGTRSQ